MTTTEDYGEPWITFTWGDDVFDWGTADMKEGCLNIGSDPFETVIAAEVLEREAQRIVACVNACQGIPTEELEKVTRHETPSERLAALSDTACYEAHVALLNENPTDPTKETDHARDPVL